MRSDEKIGAIAGKIEKQFGKGSVSRLGGREVVSVDVIPTGSLILDRATGVGGYPRGRIIEVFGPESSGKTTLALHAISSAQSGDGVAAFVDAEHALDIAYARRLGVDVDNLLVSQPDNGEQALEIALAFISGGVDLVVIDSVAALVPKAEIEGEMGDAMVGLQARLMSQAMRKMTGVVARTNSCVIFINQIREKIGVMFGSPETTTGGRALKFYASMRMDIRRQSAIKEGDVVVGARTKVKMVKNKLASPFREAEFDLIYGRGISPDLDLVDIATEMGFVEKSGAWYSYLGERIGQGRNKAAEYLSQNEETAGRIRCDVILRMGEERVV